MDLRNTLHHKLTEQSGFTHHTKPYKKLTKAKTHAAARFPTRLTKYVVWMQT